MSAGSTRRRLAVQPGEVIARDRPLSFRWDGRTYEAFEGDTIVSALLAAGIDVFSRSFKYHRPRGVLTADFHDPNCLFEVDGEPSVRGAHRLVEEGLVALSQNRWPSLRYDLKRMVAATGPFASAGFYYKTFMWPTFMRPVYQRVLRTFSPGGHVGRSDPDQYFEKRFIFHDVVVAGAGPAGMEAAIAAADDGCSVLLVDEQHGLGGHLRWGGADELATLAELRAAVATRDTIEVLTDSVVFGLYDHNWVGIVERSPRGRVRERLLKGRPRVVVAAPGLLERPYVFRGNDLPGVMLSTGVRRLVNLYAVRPGTRAVVYAADPVGRDAARDLERVGVDVSVLDAADGRGVRVARGRSRVESVELTDGTRLEADLLVVAAGWTAATALANMAGHRPTFDPASGRFVVPWDLGDVVLAAGGLVGDGSLLELRAHGRAVGREAAARAQGRTADGQVPELHRDVRPRTYFAPTNGIVDLNEDVSAKDIVSAAGEGYRSIELNKRYTTATMGIDQGKLSAVNAIAVLASARGKTIAEVGTTTWRPPYVPVSLGALAGRRRTPYRITPLHEWHERHGARFTRAGDWVRPDAYGDALAEVLAVRNGAGLIDVSTLGKFELRGRDVTQLLEHVYVNRWAKLAVGGVRYGAMVLEDGALLDDGVTGRLTDDTYLMSTTSSGSERVRRWLERWRQTEGRDWRVTIRNVTDVYAAMNLAGPRSRDVLTRLTEEVDLSPQSFPYMNVRRGRLAGVDRCFMWRIGFSGELSYELYVPSRRALEVWEAVLAAGREWGIRPYGVEAQKILRIEKGHAVVGQDTDAMVGPLAAGLGSLVRLDKQVGIGRPELAWQHANPDVLPYRLVAVQTVDPAVVPAEACQILDGEGRIAGRITSSRFSPTLGRSVALALVAPRVSPANGPIRVRLVSGDIVDARIIASHAHFDPDGARARG